ncbi:TPA: hypothetical protein NJY08_004416 [Salmonella enterica subsp. enterica serovar Typhi str. AG3]|nr:hypothetical protein [Salmonella enterica subsp. enterica serovar Typhi str. AG3]
MGIGRKLYYEIETGNIIITIDERQGAVVPTTIDQDIVAFTSLSERNRESFDVIELPYGAYEQDFISGGRIIGVDLEKNLPIFEYSNPENPDEPITPQVPMSVEIEELKKKNKLLEAQNQALTETTDFHEELIVELAMVVYS